MQSQQFGKLVKVDLRKAWNHEALDFTRWLSLDENLQSGHQHSPVEQTWNYLLYLFISAQERKA